MAFVFLLGLAACGGWFLLMSANSPLPTQWNPMLPLAVSDPVSPLTGWKLDRTTANPVLCRTALATGATFSTLDDVDRGGGCGIETRVDLSAVGAIRLDPLETTCAVALRLAMWSQHSLAPIAKEEFGTEISRLRHIGSYNCRNMRTGAGDSGRLSTHATAEAIDIAGIDLADGRKLRLIDDWQGSGPQARFWRKARDGACDWFRTTLSPDYNALHADHFHLQSVGWGRCR